MVQLRKLLVLISLLAPLVSFGQAVDAFRFETATRSMDEGSTNVDIRIYRDGDITEPGTVRYTYRTPATLPPGTTAATLGTDYLPAAGPTEVMNFQQDHEYEVILVTIPNDALTEGPEVFEIVLTAEGRSGLGSPTVLTVTINDIVSNPGKLSFATTAVNAVAGQTVQLPVQRTGGQDGEVMVNYSINTTPTPLTGMVMFGNGDQANKSISVPVPAAAPGTPDYVLTATLSSPTGGATLENPTTAQINVEVPDAPADPFVPQAATFTGLLGSDDLDGGFGQVTLTTTAASKITGKVVFNGVAFAFKGSITGAGTFQQEFKKRVGRETLTRTLNLTLGTNGLSGTFALDAKEGVQPRVIEGERNLTVARGGSAPQTGYYTMMLRNGTLQGTGFNAPGSITIAKAGTATVRATLPDGTKAALGGRISVSGAVRFSIPLYGKVVGGFAAGQRLGFLQGTAEAVAGDLTEAFDGEVTWLKPAIARPKVGQLYASGVSYATADIDAQRYTKPAARLRILTDLTLSEGAAMLMLEDGNLLNSIMHDVNIATNNKLRVLQPGTDRVVVAINPANGTFTGNFRHPEDNNRVHKFTGVVLQGAQRLEGQFNGTDSVGTIQIRPSLNE